MPPVFREDPYAGHQFEVVITGISDDGTAVKGSFAECSGLEASMDPIEYRNGSEDFTVRKIPGLKKFTNIVLKRGMLFPGGGKVYSELWGWLQSILAGVRPVARYDGIIEVLSADRKDTVATWTFDRGLPSKIAGPPDELACARSSMLPLCRFMYQSVVAWPFVVANTTMPRGHA